MIYLYIKTHNNTGLKYLGKTTKDPFTYKGSGKYWLRHIKQHGYNVTTKILFQSNDKEEIKQKGIYYSNIWNVVSSNEWANLKEETGDGGDTSKCFSYKIAQTKGLFNKHSKNKTYEEIYGLEKAISLKQQRSQSNKNRGKRSEETKRKISETRKQRISLGLIKIHNVNPDLTASS